MRKRKPHPTRVRVGAPPIAISSPLLMRTPAPLPRESLLPYALRLSMANGYSTPHFFMTKAGAEQFAPTRGVDVDQVAEAAGLSDKQIRQLRYHDAKEDPTFGRLLGIRVSSYDLSIRSPRVCPQCIEQNGHLEALWDLAWVTCCPVHECELVCRCPECDVKLIWARASLGCCQKGHNLNQGQPIPASKSSLDLARLIALKLYGPSDPFVGPWEDIKQSLVEDLSLHEVCRVAAAIGNRTARQHHTKAYLRNRSALGRMDTTMDAIRDLYFGTQEEREAFLDEISIDPSTGQRHTSFHQASKWIMNLFSPERAVEIKLVAALMAYAQKHWPPSRIKRGSSSLGTLVDSCEWISATAAGRELGVNLTTVTKRIKTGEVPHKRVSETSNHCWLVPVEWVKAQALVPVEPITMSQLRSLCGINSAIITRLRREGLVKTSIKAKTSLIRHDIDVFIDALMCTTEKIVSKKAEGQSSFHELMTSHACNAGKFALVKAVLNGTLIPTGKIVRKGTKGLLFEARAARKVLCAVKNDCPMQQANIILDCHNPQGLLQMGKLTKTRKIGDRVYVSMESVMAFRDEFSSPKPLLKTHDIQIPRLLKVARMAKIDLLPVPNTNRGGYFWFIPRSRLEDLERSIPFYRDLATPKKYRVGDLKRLNNAHVLFANATAEANARSAVVH